VPRIEFANLPLEIARHFRRKRRHRKLSETQLQQVIDWILFGDPQAPEGDWYKNFGTFYLCGTGRYPKTVLDRNMKPYGQEID
jgi:hypothetical protein